MIIIHDDDASAVVINVAEGINEQDTFMTTDASTMTKTTGIVDQTIDSTPHLLNDSLLPYDCINDQSQQEQQYPDKQQNESQQQQQDKSNTECSTNPPATHQQQQMQQRVIEQQQPHQQHHKAIENSRRRMENQTYDVINERPGHRSIPSSYMSDRAAYFDYIMVTKDIKDNDRNTNIDNSDTNRYSIQNKSDCWNKALQKHKPRGIGIRETSIGSSSSSHYYDWRKYSPRGCRNWIQFIRWLINGDTTRSSLVVTSPEQQMEQQFLHDLCCLYQCLSLLRHYVRTYGIPKQGNVSDQHYVLREVSRDLYTGGTPLWALESVMQRASEGLTGNPYVTWNFLPRHAYMYHSGSGSSSKSTYHKKKKKKKKKMCSRNSMNHQSSNYDSYTTRMNSSDEEDDYNDDDDDDYNDAPTTSTMMFKLERGFTIHRLDCIEPLVVKLASYASNTSGVCFAPYTRRFPTSDEFNLTNHLQQTPTSSSFTVINQRHKSNDDSLDIKHDHHQSKKQYQQQERNHEENPHPPNTLNEHGSNHSNTDTSDEKDRIANEILRLSSETQGIFYYVNSPEYREFITQDHSHQHTIVNKENWIVSDDELECFRRLACIDAMKSIDIIDDMLEKYPLYNNRWYVITFFRIMSCSGACIIWFNGSWYDMIVAGILGGIIISYIGESKLLSKQEKIIFEAIAGYIVGLIAGFISYFYPNRFCYSAIAISSMLDLLQGFKVVYAVIEIMSRNTVAGGADFLEGLLFTGLISYFLQFGQFTAFRCLSFSTALSEEIQRNNNSTVGDTDTSTLGWSSCSPDHGVSELWYILFVPFTALAWSGLFSPNYYDLLPMTFHGVLAFAVNYGLSKAGALNDINNFVSSMLVTFSAGLFSRFTGRQAVGNTVAGLYVLVPGAYLVTSISFQLSTDTSDAKSSSSSPFFIELIQRAIALGIGSWTGTLLCSPTLLSTTKGSVEQQTDSLDYSSHHATYHHPSSRSWHKQRVRGGRQPTMLTF